jgi:phosphate transport system substrate-binding protein
MVRLLGLAGLCALLLGGCGKSQPIREPLVLSGTRTLEPLMRDLGQRYCAQNPHIRIDLELGISTRGAMETRAGLADVGFLARELHPDETGLETHPLGRDALAFIVHRDNPLPSLTENQLVGLFARAYSSWGELGGSERSIILVGMSEGRASREFCLEYLGLKSIMTRHDLSLSTSEQVVQAVANRPGAIGYISLASAREVLPHPQVRILPLAGVLPDPETIRTSKYPFVRQTILVTRPHPSEKVQAFLRFATDPDQHDLLLKHGLAPP